MQYLRGAEVQGFRVHVRVQRTARWHSFVADPIARSPSSREAIAHFVSVRWVPAPVFSHEARLQLLSRGQFHLPLDILAQSNRGRKLCAFSRYCLYRPCFTTVTIPTLRSTRKCLEA